MLKISTRNCRPCVSSEAEVLAEHQVGLPEARAAQEVARQVAERAGLRRRERGRVQPAHAVLQIRIDAGNQVRPLRAAAVAAGDVGDRRAVDRGVVGTRHHDVDRHAAARVDDAADAPAAGPEAVAGNQVDERAVERVRDVLRVGAVLGLVVERVLRRRRFVRALRRALVARVLILEAAGEAGAEAARRAQLQRVVGGVAAAR